MRKLSILLFFPLLTLAKPVGQETSDLNQWQDFTKEAQSRNFTFKGEPLPAYQDNLNTKLAAPVRKTSKKIPMINLKELERQLNRVD